MAAVYTIAAIDANTALITTPTKKWRTQLGASTYVDLETGEVVVTFGGTTMRLTKATIITVGGAAPDDNPDVLCDQISACFPATGTVTIAPSVTIDGQPVEVHLNDTVDVSISSGLPVNNSVTLRDVLEFTPTGNTPGQTNEKCRGGIITIVTQNMVGSPSATFELQEYNETTTNWERLATLTSAITVNGATKAIVYPGAEGAQYQLLPLTWRVSWNITGIGAFDGCISVNYVV